MDAKAFLVQARNHPVKTGAMDWESVVLWVVLKLLSTSLIRLQASSLNLHKFLILLVFMDIICYC